MSSIALPIKFNEQVEGDILFYEQEMIWQMVCRTTRWHAAVVITSKNTTSLLQAIEDCWVRIHGPMQEFYVDGEMGLQDEEALSYFNLRGIQ